MRVLIEIGHPAHVHFFRRFIERAKNAGHELRIITRNKDITNALLEKLGIPYVTLSTPFRRRSLLFVELLWRWLKTFSLLVRYRIDRAVSISGITTSLPSKLAGVPNVVFTDTEDAKISNYISFPFADTILTPRFYLGDLGVKHQRYEGLHELSYLQDFDFQKAAVRRQQLGLPEKYFILRTIANDAIHDWDIQGMRIEQLRRVISLLSAHGKVFITSEGKGHPGLAAYRLETPLVDIHAVLAGALLFLGESPTMAVESSLLGTPAFLLSQRVGRLGNMVGLEKEYQLLANFSDSESLVASLAAITDFDSYKREWTARATQYRERCEDMDALIFDSILGPSSAGRERIPCAA